MKYLNYFTFPRTVLLALLIFAGYTLYSTASAAPVVIGHTTWANVFQGLKTLPQATAAIAKKLAADIVAINKLNIAPEAKAIRIKSVRNTASNAQKFANNRHGGWDIPLNAKTIVIVPGIH